ncbi:MAG: hypothetical protein F6J86_02405 [Symploca sp. SIO1B1]|nr:hypothetical protein [Symploca sp. SIO1B1]
MYFGSRRQEAEGRRQEAEGRRQKAGDESLSVMTFYLQPQEGSRHNLRFGGEMNCGQDVC